MRFLIPNLNRAFLLAVPLGLLLCLPVKAQSHYSKAVLDALRKTFQDNGFEAIPKDRTKWKKWTNPEKKPTHEARVELGRQLFHDPRLSKSRMVSCAKCHVPGLAGTDGLKVSHGLHGKPNPHKLNTPTVFNSVFNSSHFWDGRSPNLENQADISLGGLHEMAFDLPAAVDFFRKVPGYQESLKTLYNASFPRDLSSHSNLQKGRKAYNGVLDSIARFQRELLTPAPFDEFVLGNDDAISALAIEGALLFVQKNCIECHDGPALGGQQMADFPRFGEYPWLDKKSLYLKGDKAELKVPLLRNVGRTAPYFHDGNVRSLKGAIDWMGKLQLDIELSDAEISALEEFLISLNGDLSGNKWPVLPVESSLHPEEMMELSEKASNYKVPTVERMPNDDSRRPQVFMRSLTIPLKFKKGRQGQ